MTKVNKLMTEVASIKAKLAKALLGKVEMNAVKTDKAVLVYDGDELAVGVEVFVEDEEGNRTPAEDGIYVLEDGQRLNVAEGKIAEILEKEEEVEPEEAELAEDETAEYVTKEAFDALATEVAELYTLVEALTAKVEGGEARLAKVEKTPAGKTPAQEFKSERGEISTGNPTFDRKLNNIRKFRE